MIFSRVEATQLISGDRTRLAELDVLRGFAALAVMIYHHTAIFQSMYGSGRPAPPIPYGILAVHLFFMISGFVIFMTLSRTRTPMDFIVSRLSRLFPVFWVAVLFTQLVVSLAPLPTGSVTWREAAVNLTMLAGPLGVQWVDNVYWSLVIELSFYTIMLSLFITGWIKEIEHLVIPWIFAEITAICLAHRAHQAIPQALAVVFLLKYAHLFLAGVLFYRLRFIGPSRARHLLLGCCLITQFIVHGFWAGLFGAAFFGLFYALSMRRFPLVTMRPLVFLGTISYSLYLIHQNIGYVIMRALSSTPRIVQVLAATVTVLVLAVLLTFLVEKPALRLIRSMYKKRLAKLETGERVSETRTARL